MKNISNTTLEGKYVFIRPIKVSDASFVLELRCDKKKSRFLHKTENNLAKQQDYIRRCQTLTNEWYFIIENRQHQAIGTYRIYDLHQDSFCIGSWLMKQGCSVFEMMEGEYLVKMFAFEKTGFKKFHFDVRKDNKKVIRYHRMMGAQQVGETEKDYLFECTKEDYLKQIHKFL